MVERNKKYIRNDSKIKDKRPLTRNKAKSSPNKPKTTEIQFQSPRFKRNISKIDALIDREYDVLKRLGE
jgi:hypothetical protein